MPHSLLPVVEARRAYRAISDRPISRDALQILVQAAHWAPSCANNQPWRFVVVDAPDVLKPVKEALSGGNYWAQPSPAIIAVVSQEDLDCRIPDGRDYFLFGCGLAAMNLMLQATHMGLIAHPIAGYRSRPVKHALGVPEDHTVITLIILGYPAETPDLLSEKHLIEETAPRVRRPLQDVLAWNAWSSLPPLDVPSKGG